MDVITFPSAGLSSVSSRVEKFDNELTRLAADMVETMYEQNGVGLAAPQVGRNIRLIVVDPSSGHKQDNLLVMVNPVVTWKSREETTQAEGCLSVPGFHCDVSRAAAVAIIYQGIKGSTHESTFVGATARIIQHEIDHLDGLTIADRQMKSHAQKNITSREAHA